MCVYMYTIAVDCVVFSLHLYIIKTFYIKYSIIEPNFFFFFCSFNLRSGNIFLRLFYCFSVFLRFFFLLSLFL